MMYFTLCNPPQTIWNLAKPHFLGRFHHKGKHSFENVAKGVSLILKQGHSIASFQHGVLESRSTWMSPEASLRIWMPAIHAGMSAPVKAPHQHGESPCRSMPQLRSRR